MFSLTITLKIPKKFPSHNAINKCSNIGIKIKLSTSSRLCMHITFSSYESHNCDKTALTHVIVSRSSRIKTKANFCLIYAHHLFTYKEYSKTSPLALTHAVNWWHHCCTAHAWWYGLAVAHSVNSREYCVLYRQSRFSEVDIIPVSTNLCQANNCYFLKFCVVCVCVCVCIYYVWYSG